jgi:hypothetical protein
MDAFLTVPTSSGGGSAFGPLSHFAALIAYEDLASGRRAKAALDRLAPALSAEGSVACQMWRFDMLDDDAARREAAAEAARADLVMVAAQLSSELPSVVKNWIWTWLPQRQVPGGALALTFEDCAECERLKTRPESPLCKALRRAATTGWMDFVCTRSNWQRTSEEAYLRRLLERARKTSSTLEGILSHRGAPHGGLNE